MTSPEPLPADVETWAQVVGFPRYEVSTLGRVRSVDFTYTDVTGRSGTRRGKELRPFPTKDGRPRVSLGRGNERYVYRLVLEAFVGPCPPGSECCHNDGDQTNSRLSNLRWDTHGGNMQDAVRHGTHFATKRTRCPRGHLLAVPNVVRHALLEGTRECLSCSRAQSRTRWGASKGFTFDRVALSHAYYAALIPDDAELMHRGAA